MFEGLNRIEGNIDKPVLAGPFHELGDAAIVIDLHNHKQSGFSVRAYDLTQERDFSGTTIRFNNNAGNGGTH